MTDQQIIQMSRGTYGLIANVLPRCLADVVDAYILPHSMDEAMSVGHYELAMALIPADSVGCASAPAITDGSRAATIAREDVIVRLFRMACGFGHVEIARPLQRLDVTFASELWWTCFTGDVGLIEYAVRSATCMNYGLSGACEGGHVGIAKWMIRLGAYDVNAGLYSACKYNQPKTAHLMILCGAKRLDDALVVACTYDSFDVFEMLINRGATCKCMPTLPHRTRAAIAKADPNWVYTPPREYYGSL